MPRCALILYPAIGAGKGAEVTALDGVDAKLGRALEHLLSLDNQMHEYLDSNPIGVQRQLQQDAKTSVFALVIERSPPLELAVLAGEVVHQLRSALDHLANQLVRVAGNTPTRRTAFPVLLRPPDQVLKIDGGVDPSALDAVASLQPHLRGLEPEGHPLAILNELWNRDKHRNLSLMATYVTGTQIFLVDPEGQWMVGGQFQTTPLGHGDIVGVFSFADGDLPTDAIVQASGSHFLTLAEEGPWGRQPVTNLLESLHQFVTVTVVPKLKPFC